jgi:MoaA/NifB/PqqE/SkfB family radical SAM enzyme
MPATVTGIAPTEPYRRLWAELTNRCQLECVMCYARSGPDGSHGASVSLAFSYFAKDAAAHNAVTGRPSHKATRRNAEKAASLGIPIRAGVIDFGHVREAVNDLNLIGVTKVATDRVRHIGRGGDSTPAPAELCGRCGHDVAAVSADGDVSPCIFSRWLRVGNVRQTPLADILGSPEMAAALASIPARTDPCDPDTECPPGFPPSSCSPRN